MSDYGEAMRVGSLFLQAATQKHQRFLALAFESSYKTLDWIASSAAEAYSVRSLGVFDKIKVLEFDPRPEADASRPADLASQVPPGDKADSPARKR